MVLPWIRHNGQRHRLLALALLALQVALMFPAQPSVLTAATLIHFALILLWQPVWQASTRVDNRATIVTLAVGTAVVLLNSWLLLFTWLMVLLGLVGGEQAGGRREQSVQWLVTIYLLVALLVGAMPPLFDIDAGDSVLRTVVLAVGIIPLALLFLPASTPPAFVHRFDYLRSLAITLLALMLAGGSMLWTYRTGTPYPITLIETTLFVAGLILVVNGVWQRRASHSMFQVLWNRYLLNVGTPFEHYLVSLSGPSTIDLGPDDYLNRAIEEMVELSWVQGVEVRGPAGERLAGERTVHATEGYDDMAPLIVYTANDPGPTLRLHIQLLARLIQQLYHSRLHEVELRNQEKARAVHETGARLTHDIKNLLQSLQSLAAAVAPADKDRSDEALALVQRQLPDINQRLQSTLEKLRDPATANGNHRVTASGWWEQLRRRYADGSVEFTKPPAMEAQIPGELFDTVAENLIENARRKRATDAIDIRARLEINSEGIVLEVEDSGYAVSEPVARGLFTGAVHSADGLGVGLYQCARLAAYHNYELSLQHNENGHVCFRLIGGWVDHNS